MFLNLFSYYILIQLFKIIFLILKKIIINCIIYKCIKTTSNQLLVLTTTKIVLIYAVSKGIRYTPYNGSTYFTGCHFSELSHGLIAVEGRVRRANDVWGVFQRTWWRAGFAGRVNASVG